MEELFKLAEKTTRRAREVIQETGVEEAWKSIGATVNLVGSLNMGLMMIHRDIDFHIYTPELNIAQSFQAITKIASNSSIKRVEYNNLIETEEVCLEWHAWYEDCDHQLWQLDMIHILKGSAYDGFAEKAAERIKAVMTPEYKRTILKLKYETPESEKIMGIEYYRAVIEGGVKTFPELTEWRAQHKPDSVWLWHP